MYGLTDLIYMYIYIYIIKDKFFDTGTRSQNSRDIFSDDLILISDLGASVISRAITKTVEGMK